MQKTFAVRRFLPIAIATLAILLMVRSCSRVETKDFSVFTVGRTATAAEIKEKLKKQDFAQGQWFLGLALFLHGGAVRIRPGGYKIFDGMGAWAIAAALTSDPPLKWVTIPEGLRSEQTADRLADALGWDNIKRDAFLNANVKTPYDLTDGFYFPDTYLIPVDESGPQVAQRFINRFNESFAPYISKFRQANIKYDTAIKLASLIQREAGGASDMPLIAGILWNRLLIAMPLQVDATLQYARGDTGSGSWAPVAAADKQIDSLFNTYKHTGLPPSPISNPGLDAIDAVLHSEDTKCLYYLHDRDRQIHCAVTYAEHLKNIEKYLKNQP